MKMDSSKSPEVAQIKPERKRYIGCGVLLFILALGVLSSSLKGGIALLGLRVSVSSGRFGLILIGLAVSAPLVYLGIRMIKATPRASPIMNWIDGLLIVLGMPLAAVAIIEGVCDCLFSDFGRVGSAVFLVFVGIIMAVFVGLLACHKEIIREYRERRRARARE